MAAGSGRDHAGSSDRALWHALSRDNDYARIAAQSAREAALEEMNRRNQAKAGLEKRRGRQTHPPALTEEEKIIEQISQARGGSIF